MLALLQPSDVREVPNRREVRHQLNLRVGAGEQRLGQQRERRVAPAAGDAVVDQGLASRPARRRRNERRTRHSPAPVPAASCARRTRSSRTSNRRAAAALRAPRATARALRPRPVRQRARTSRDRPSRCRSAGATESTAPLGTSTDRARAPLERPLVPAHRLPAGVDPDAAPPTPPPPAAGLRSERCSRRAEARILVSQRSLPLRSSALSLEKEEGRQGRLSPTRLTHLRNRVEAQTPEAHPARNLEPLHRGNRVLTHEQSNAELTFVDETQLQLGERTTVVVFGESAQTQTAARSSAQATLQPSAAR